MESKKNNNLQNIFLRDDSDSTSSTIIAKSGYVTKKSGHDFLILFDGMVQKEKVKSSEFEEKKISTINFTKTEINLSKYAANTITHPKIQERTSLALFACLVKFTSSIFSSFDSNDWASENCYYWTEEKDMKRNANEYLNELNRRFILPFYIPLIALISCFLLSSKKENKNSLLRLFCFVTGILIIIFAEISLRSSNNSKTLLYVFYTFPLAFGILNYLILLKIFSFESLKK